MFYGTEYDTFNEKFIFLKRIVTQENISDRFIQCATAGEFSSKLYLFNQHPDDITTLFDFVR